MSADHEALAAALLAAGRRRGELLQSIVHVARAIFLAEAASIAVLDDEAGDFRFEAVSGRGEEIIGMHFPAGQGLAGTAAQTGEPLIVDDLQSETRFARGVAEKTGYVPAAMMVAPLLSGEETLGVLSVLDRGRTDRAALQELELLMHFADQAAIALDITGAATRAAATLSEGPETGPLGRLAAGMASASPKRQLAIERLLHVLEELLDPEDGLDELER